MRQLTTEPENMTEPGGGDVRRPRKLASRLTLLLRRIHLYVGLFLLPWVFLYAITAAMFNHQNLLPEVSIARVNHSSLTDTPMADFPSGPQLATQVIEALRSAAPEETIEVDDSHRPEFTNDIILQVNESGTKHAVHINPIRRSAWVATFPEKEHLEPLLSDIHNIKLDPNPYDAARNSVQKILRDVGIESSGRSQPMGWSKLNFLATVNGQPARVTYVLRDGHVDVTKHTGRHGMSTRGFFLRLHTTHGQPPHWNGRMFWSLFVDLMALAMVTWGITGLVMWWQIKRTRLIGGAVMALSVSTAAVIFFSMVHFYGDHQAVAR